MRATGLVLVTGLVLALEVPKPDLASTEPSVREKIEAHHRRVSANPDDAAAWGRYGMVLDAHRYQDQALAAYREAHRLEPKEFRWPYFAAVLLDYRDPEQALEWHRRALTIDAQYAPARVRMAEVLEKLGRRDDARRHFERAARLDPSNALAHLGLGRIALLAGDTGEAVSRLERAYELAPDVQAVVATLARAYHRAGRDELARQRALEARELPRVRSAADPRRAEVTAEAVNVESFLRRSRTYLDVGQLDRARQELETLLAEQPDHAEAHLLLAEVHNRSGELEPALRSARRALELDSGSLPAGAVVASALFKLGRYAEAERQARAVLEVEPRNFHMLVLLCLAAIERGDVAELVVLADRAFEARTSDVELRGLLGQLLLQLAESNAAIGEFPRAARRMEQVLRLAQEDGAPASTLEAYRARLRAYQAGRGS